MPKTPPIVAAIAEDSVRQSPAYKSLERHAAQLEQRLAGLKKSKWALPTAKRAKSTGAFLRVIIPDTHGSHIDPRASATFLADLEVLDPREVVLLGDHIDCGGYLSEKHTIGYVAEMEYSYSDDIDAANTFLDAVQKRASKASYHYLEGNHEHRVEQWCVTKMKNRKDALRQLRHDAFWEVLSLDQRGIKYYRASEEYGGVRNKATVKLGQCYFTHGSFTGKTAAQNMAHCFGGNVVFGHTHRRMEFPRPNVHGGEYGAWSLGCLSRLRPYWRHTAPSEWSHGYGIQIVHADGDFWQITVPIIEGKSMMATLTDNLGRRR
jgi:UDP-2,3-diacylglucosamine pyrophosphatase LpxH